MSTRQLFSIPLLILLFINQSVLAQYSGSGSGTEADPYLITNVLQLQEMQNDVTAHYVLANDIDASATVGWNNGAGFEPIGSSEDFIGTLDGKGHVISGLYINRPDKWYVGLIAEVSLNYTFVDNEITEIKNGTVKNLGLEDVDITGYATVGGIAGRNARYVNQCYVTGKIHGISHVGGITGDNFNNGLIKNCYSTADVSGEAKNVGGIAGISSHEIINSYFAGTISGLAIAKGAVLGTSDNGGSDIENSYWNKEVAGYTGGHTNATGYTTYEMLQQNSYLNWDFTEVWGIDELNSYPYLKWQTVIKDFNKVPVTIAPQFPEGVHETGQVKLSWQIPSTTAHLLGYRIYRDGVLLNTNALITNNQYTDLSFDPSVFPTYYITAVFDNQGQEAESIASEEVWVFLGFAGGDGTVDNPYQISTIDQLQAIDLFTSSHFEIINDIDASETSTSNDGAGFIPIGSYTNKFTGSLNGNGYTIKELTIYRPKNRYAALFEFTTSAAKITNVHLADVDIKGDGYMAGMVAYNSGKIVRCSVTGTLISNATEENFAGGLVAYNMGIISECYTSCTIKGRSEVGGLAGRSNGNNVSNSYSNSIIEGKNYVGGLLGQGTVTNCYAMGSVKGDTYVGGLTGGSNTAKNSYAINQVTATSRFAGNISGSGSSAIQNLYWNIETCLQMHSFFTLDEATESYHKLTTAEMLQQSSFVDWDFDNVWKVEEGVTYPYFQWQESSFHNQPIKVLAPASLNATPATNTVQLKWNQPSISTSLKGYNIYRDSVLLNTNTLVTSTEYTDSEPGTSVVIYHVTAVYDDNGSEIESHYSIPVLVSAGFAGGDGSIDDPYQISTVEQLQNMAYLLDDHFVIINDIDASSTASWNDGKGFEPIGELLNNPFNGSLKGNEHVIRGITVNREMQDYVGATGLMGCTYYNAVIDNLVLEEVNITGRDHVGSVVGRNQGEVNNCHAQGYISGYRDVGGVTGHNLGSITGCSFTGIVDGTNWYNGGVAGYNKGNITACHANAEVYGEYYCGGLIGGNKNTISLSYTTGKVIGRSDIGGFVGENEGTIENCYTMAEVSGTYLVGGFSGNKRSDSKIINVYAAGKVNEVSEYSGGIAGEYSPYDLFENSFWNTETTGQSEGVGYGDGEAGITGLSTNLMRKQSSFTGWDFENVWSIRSGDSLSYPFLRNNRQDPEPGLFTGVTSTKTAKAMATDIKVFPVPSNSYVLADLSLWSPVSCQAKLIDIYGITRKELELQGGKVNEISLQDLSAGHYTLLITGVDRFSQKSIMKIK